MLKAGIDRRAVLAAGVSLLLPGSARAGGYPDKLVRIVVPFPPGGVYDLYARIAAEYLTKTMGQEFIVENHAGGQGALGLQLVATAEADGYTLLMGGQATQATNPHLFSNLQYDTLKDFSGIALVAMVGNVLVVNPSVPAKTVEEFIAYAKANPGKVTFSHAGAGTSMSLAGELFKERTGTDLVSVPYRGSALAANAVVNGEVKCMFANTISVLGQIRAGTVRPIGVTTLTRQALIPDVLPVAEQGVPGYEMRSWFGLFAPAKTPRPIVTQLNAALLRMASDPEMQKKIADSGATSSTFSPKAFDDFVQADYTAIGRIVKMAGLKAN